MYKSTFQVCLSVMITTCIYVYIYAREQGQSREYERVSRSLLISNRNICHLLTNTCIWCIIVIQQGYIIFCYRSSLNNTHQEKKTRNNLFID